MRPAPLTAGLSPTSHSPPLPSALHPTCCRLLPAQVAMRATAGMAAPLGAPAPRVVTVRKRELGRSGAVPVQLRRALDGTASSLHGLLPATPVHPAPPSILVPSGGDAGDGGAGGDAWGAGAEGGDGEWGHPIHQPRAAAPDLTGAASRAHRPTLTSMPYLPRSPTSTTLQVATRAMAAQVGLPLGLTAASGSALALANCLPVTPSSAARCFRCHSRLHHPFPPAPSAAGGDAEGAGAVAGDGGSGGDGGAGRLTHGGGDVLPHMADSRMHLLLASHPPPIHPPFRVPRPLCRRR